jgi:hypothetical protein
VQQVGVITNDYWLLAVQFTGSNTERFVSMVQQPPEGQGLIIEALRSHSDTPQSVGLLFPSDRPVAETSTWQHTTLTTNIHVTGGIRTHNPSKRVAADPRLRPPAHRDRSITYDAYLNLKWPTMCQTATVRTVCYRAAGQLSRYTDWLRARRSGIESRCEARFSAPVQTGPGAH